MIKKVKTRYTTTFNRWLAVNEETLRVEEALGIETRWMPDSPEYKEALVTLRERKYRRALDKLERLVVQRLFELTKIGMSGIGMPHDKIQSVDLIVFVQGTRCGRRLVRP
jgi:hypothetical protein